MMNSEVIENTDMTYDVFVIDNDGSNITFELNGIEFTRNKRCFKNVPIILEQAFEHASNLCEEIVEISNNNNLIELKIKNAEGVIYNISIERYLKIIKYKYRFIECVYNNGHELLTSYITQDEYVLIDFHCGHGPQAVRPYSYIHRGVRCSVCSHNKIVPYINDVYTLRPDMLKYFANINDAIGIAVYSNKEIDFICPSCGTIKKSTMRDVIKHGFSCHVCGDGISAPEKFMENILIQLNIDFEIHKYPDWGYYILDGTQKRAQYDFVLEDRKLIIEMDGIFHYVSGMYGNYNQQNVDLCKNKLAEQNGYSIIRVDCYYKKDDAFDYIKSSVISSLSEIFNFDNIDWEQVNKSMMSSKMRTACELWNHNVDIKDICDELKVSKITAIKYLCDGNSIGLCHYNQDEQNLKNIKKQLSVHYKWVKMVDYKSNEVLGVYFDIDNFMYNYYKKYGFKLNRQGIRLVLKNDQKYTKGYNERRLSFVEISKSEYDELIHNTDLINDIVDCNIPIIFKYVN